jgi:hypothetical protein
MHLCSIFLAAFVATSPRATFLMSAPGARGVLMSATAFLCVAIVMASFTHMESSELKE